MDRDNDQLGRTPMTGGTEAAVMDIWTFRTAEPLGDIDVTGYSVETTDGGIGKVDEATYEVGGSAALRTRSTAAGSAVTTTATARRPRQRWATARERLQSAAAGR
jgi:hypothetical protein